MSSQLQIDGKDYVTATTAGKHFGYTKDYMLLLAKDGKIDGKKIGHKWHINIPSAKSFFAHAEKSREIRRRKISLERKSELKMRTLARSGANQNRTAILETLVIVIIGLSLGATGYLGTVNQNATVADAGGQGFFKSLAVSLYEFISPRTEVVKVITVRTPSDMEHEEIATHIGTTTVTSLIVAPDELFTAETIDAVRDSFSDEVNVSVDPENPDTGVITPQFKNKEGEAYRFLMVPVTTRTP